MIFHILSSGLDTFLSLIVGFARVSEDKTSVIIPDYSGNRFFQTLGNIQIDGTAGLFFVDYNSGDALYITGDAFNYFDEAKNIFPPFSRITVISVSLLFVTIM